MNASVQKIFGFGPILGFYSYLGHELCNIIAVKFRFNFCVSDSISCGLIPSSNNSLHISEAGDEFRILK